MMGISLFAVAVTNPVSPALASGPNYEQMSRDGWNENDWGNTRFDVLEQTVPGLTVVNGVCVSGNGGSDYGLPEGTVSGRFSCSVPGDASTYSLECTREQNGESIPSTPAVCLSDPDMAQRITQLFNETSGSNVTIVLDNSEPAGFRVDDPNGSMSCGSSRYRWDYTVLGQCGGLATGVDIKCLKGTSFGDGNETWTEATFQECEVDQGPADEDYLEYYTEPTYETCTNLRVITGDWTPDANTQCGEFIQIRPASCVYDGPGGELVPLDYGLCANAQNYFTIPEVQDTYALNECVANPDNADLYEVLEYCEPHTDIYGDTVYIPKGSRTVTGTMSSCAGGDGAGGRYEWSYSDFPPASGCGTITLTRDVTCIDTEDSNRTVGPELCNLTTKPPVSTTENVLDTCDATCTAAPVIGNCATQGYNRLIASDWNNFETATLGNSGTCNEVTGGAALYRHDTFVDASCPGTPNAVTPPAEPQQQQCQNPMTDPNYASDNFTMCNSQGGAGYSCYSLSVGWVSVPCNVPVDGGGSASCSDECGEDKDNGRTWCTAGTQNLGIRTSKCVDGIIVHPTTISGLGCDAGAQTACN